MGKLLALLRLGGIASWLTALIPGGGIVASIFEAVTSAIKAVVASVTALLKDPAAYLAVGIFSLMSAWAGIEFADRLHDRSQIVLLTAEKKSNEACHADLKEAKAFVAERKAEDGERERIRAEGASTPAAAPASAGAPAAARRLRTRRSADASGDGGSWLQSLKAVLPQ